MRGKKESEVVERTLPQEKQRTGIIISMYPRWVGSTRGVGGNEVEEVVKFGCCRRVEVVNPKILALVKFFGTSVHR